MPTMIKQPNKAIVGRRILTANPADKKKLAVFDVEGVLIPKNRLFFEMGKHLGTAAFLKILFYGFLYQLGLMPIKKALKGVYGLMKGAETKQLLESLEKIPLMPNVKETFLELKQAGYKIALISSGLPAIIVEELAQAVGADYAVGLHVGTEDEFLTGQIWGDTIEQNGKLLALNEILKHEGCRIEDCVVVADDRNNQAIFLKEAHKVAYNPDFVLRIKADAVVMGKFRNLLTAIKKEKRPSGWPSSKDTLREAIHASGIFIPAIALAAGKAWVALGIALVITVYSASEITRINGRSMPIISSITSRAASQYELSEVALSPLYYAFGILLTLLLFPNPASSAAIAMFTLGDSSASIIGATISKRPLPFNRAKTLEGSIGGFLFAFLGGLLFINPALALAGAAVAMLIEYLPLPINDNLMVPIGTGLALTLLI